MPPQPRINPRGRRHSPRRVRADARRQGNPCPHPLAAHTTADERQEHGDKQGSETEVHKHCTTAWAGRPGDQSPDEDGAATANDNCSTEQRMDATTERSTHCGTATWRRKQ